MLDRLTDIVEESTAAKVEKLNSTYKLSVSPFTAHKFVKSCISFYCQYGRLSPKQVAVLRDIEDEKAHRRTYSTRMPDPEMDRDWAMAIGY